MILTKEAIAKLEKVREQKILNPENLIMDGYLRDNIRRGHGDKSDIAGQIVINELGSDAAWNIFNEDRYNGIPDKAAEILGLERSNCEVLFSLSEWAEELQTSYSDLCEQINRVSRSPIQGHNYTYPLHLEKAKIVCVIINQFISEHQRHK